MQLIASQQAASAADIETAISIATVTLQDAQREVTRLIHVGPSDRWRAARIARDEAFHALSELIKQKDLAAADRVAAEAEGRI